MAPDNAAALVNLGAALSSTGRIAEAITFYERAAKIKPNYMAFSNLGTAYSRGKRYEDAAAAYRKALDIDDKAPMVWGNLAYVYSWMGGMDKRAVATFNRAIELGEAKRQKSPRDVFVHSDLALYYAKLRKADLAQQRLNTALALSPKGAEVHAAAAEVYELLGRRAKAIDFAGRSLSLGFSRQRLQRNPELAKVLHQLP